MTRSAILILSLFCLLATVPVVPARSAEIGGVTLPDRFQVGGMMCTLAGSGLRKKFFIKVYAAGLYLSHPATSLDEAVKSDQPKAILMRFIYDGVSGEKLREGWREGFDNNTPDADADLRKREATFIDLFQDTAREGDLIGLAYQPGRGTQVSFNGREAATIPGSDFNQALLNTWFGPHPADSGLKEKIADELGN